MPAPLDSDTLARIEVLHRGRQSASAIARTLGIDRHTVGRYLGKLNATSGPMSQPFLEAPPAREQPAFATPDGEEAHAQPHPPAPASVQAQLPPFTPGEVAHLRVLATCVRRVPCQNCRAWLYIPRWLLVAKGRCATCGLVWRYPRAKPFAKRIDPAFGALAARR
jgi:hypothetical protein